MWRAGSSLATRLRQERESAHSVEGWNILGSTRHREDEQHRERQHLSHLPEERSRWVQFSARRWYCLPPADERRTRRMWRNGSDRGRVARSRDRESNQEFRALSPYGPRARGFIDNSALLAMILHNQLSNS